MLLSELSFGSKADNTSIAFVTISSTYDCGITISMYAHACVHYIIQKKLLEASKERYWSSIII